MNALVGGTLLVGGLGPGTQPAPLKSGPALYSFMAGSVGRCLCSRRSTINLNHLAQMSHLDCSRTHHSANDSSISYCCCCCCNDGRQCDVATCSVWNAEMELSSRSAARLSTFP